jgi:HK97 family phage portal protein
VIQFLKDAAKRWFGSSYTQYEPGTGRIVAAHNAASAGVDVTLESALSIPAFFHGLRVLGQTVGLLDFDLIHHTVTTDAAGVEQSRHEIARMHPVHIMLHSEPNEFQNASEWRECMMAHAVSTGNGYSYIQRNGNFRPTALIPLLPDRTRPIVTKGNLSYQTVVNGQAISLDPWEVFHVKGFSWNGVSGLPLIEVMKNALGLDLAQTQFASQFYNNGANMGGIVEYPGAMSDTARQNVKSSMHREYGGIANAFKTLFLEEGFKWTSTGIEPAKAQFIEGRQFSLGDLARVIGVPPHILYDLARSTNNNIEHLGITAVQYCFAPWTNKFVQEANRKLLYESEKFEYSTRIDLKPLMAGDSTSQAGVDTARFNTLAITPNEIRAKDGRNPIEGGDSLFLNTAYLPLGVAIAKPIAATATTPPITPQPTGNDAEDDEGDDTPPGNPGAGIEPPDGPEVPANLVEDERAIFTPIVRDAIGRIARREAKAIDAALAKHEPQSFRKWYAEWEPQHRRHIAEVMQPITEATAAAGIVLPKDYIDTYLATSRRDIDQVLQAEPEFKTDAKWSVLNRWTGDRVDESTNFILGDDGSKAV